MKELVKAIRHETLSAIDSGEKLLQAIGDEPGRGTETLRQGTQHFVRRVKEELARWEAEYHKARSGS